jgi:hypothetical protein
MPEKNKDEKSTASPNWLCRMAGDFARLMQRLGAGIVIGYLLGAAFYIFCFVIAFRIEPRSEWWLNVLLCMFGGVLGWFVGTLVSPMTGAEETRFVQYSRALSAFVTGFVAAKLEFLLSRFEPTDRAETALLIGRLLLFAITFFLGLQFPFIARWQGRLKVRRPRHNSSDDTGRRGE